MQSAHVVAKIFFVLFLCYFLSFLLFFSVTFFPSFREERLKHLVWRAQTNDFFLGKNAYVNALFGAVLMKLKIFHIFNLSSTAKNWQFTWNADTKICLQYPYI